MSKKRKKIGPLIYCGPSFSGELQQFTVVKEIPKYLDTHIEKCPEIEKMFVPIKELIGVRNKMKIKGSKESHLHNKILKYQKEG